MWFETIIREETGCAAYMIGCQRTGDCAVFDPGAIHFGPIIPFEFQINPRKGSHGARRSQEMHVLGCKGCRDIMVVLKGFQLVIDLLHHGFIGFGRDIASAIAFG